MAKLRLERSEELDMRLLMGSFIALGPGLTCVSKRISGRYSVQQTRFRSEHTLNRSPASGWKQAKTPFSLMEIRRSRVRARLGVDSPLRMMRMIHSCSTAVHCWLILRSMGMICSLNNEQVSPQVYELFQSSSRQAIQQHIDAIDGEQACLKSRSCCNLVIGDTSKISGMRLCLSVRSIPNSDTYFALYRLLPLLQSHRCFRDLVET